jgi:DNA-binding PadR family transcriptional regulator
MRSTLGYALLSLIATEPQTGYDLSRALQERLSYFWQAKHSQIYPELAKLEEASLIQHKVVPQNGKPDKKVYTITEAGLVVLRDWVTTPMDMPASRDELLVKMVAVWLVDPSEAAALLREHERLHAEQLAFYEGMCELLQAKWRAGGARRDAPILGNYLTVMRGIGYEREYIAWCRWAAELLEGKVSE